MADSVTGVSGAELQWVLDFRKALQERGQSFSRSFLGADVAVDLSAGGSPVVLTTPQSVSDGAGQQATGLTVSFNGQSFEVTDPALIAQIQDAAARGDYAAVADLIGPLVVQGEYSEGGFLPGPTQANDGTSFENASGAVSGSGDGGDDHTLSFDHESFIFDFDAGPIADVVHYDVTLDFHYPVAPPEGTDAPDFAGPTVVIGGQEVTLNLNGATFTEAELEALGAFDWTSANTATARFYIDDVRAVLGDALTDKLLGIDVVHADGSSDSLFGTLFAAHNGGYHSQGGWLHLDGVALAADLEAVATALGAVPPPVEGTTVTLADGTTWVVDFSGVSLTAEEIEAVENFDWASLGTAPHHSQFDTALRAELGDPLVDKLLDIRIVENGVPGTPILGAILARNAGHQIPGDGFYGINGAGFGADLNAVLDAAPLAPEAYVANVTGPDGKTFQVEVGDTGDPEAAVAQIEAYLANQAQAADPTADVKSFSKPVRDNGDGTYSVDINTTVGGTSTTETYTFSLEAVQRESYTGSIITPMGDTLEVSIPESTLPAAHDAVAEEIRSNEPGIGLDPKTGDRYGFINFAKPMEQADGSYMVTGTRTVQDGETGAVTVETKTYSYSLTEPSQDGPQVDGTVTGETPEELVGDAHQEAVFTLAETLLTVTGGEIPANWTTEQYVAFVFGNAGLGSLVGTEAWTEFTAQLADPAKANSPYDLDYSMFDGYFEGGVAPNLGNLVAEGVTLQRFFEAYKPDVTDDIPDVLDHATFGEVYSDLALPNQDHGRRLVGEIFAGATYTLTYGGATASGTSAAAGAALIGTVAAGVVVVGAILIVGYFAYKSYKDYKNIADAGVPETVVPKPEKPQADYAGVQLSLQLQHLLDQGDVAGAVDLLLESEKNGLSQNSLQFAIDTLPDAQFTQLMTAVYQRVAGETGQPTDYFQALVYGRDYSFVEDYAYQRSPTTRGALEGFFYVDNSDPSSFGYTLTTIGAAERLQGIPPEAAGTILSLWAEQQAKDPTEFPRVADFNETVALLQSEDQAGFGRIMSELYRESPTGRDIVLDILTTGTFTADQQAQILIQLDPVDAARVLEAWHAKDPTAASDAIEKMFPNFAAAILDHTDPDVVVDIFNTIDELAGFNILNAMDPFGDAALAVVNTGAGTAAYNPNGAAPVDVPEAARIRGVQFAGANTRFAILPLGTTREEPIFALGSSSLSEDGETNNFLVFRDAYEPDDVAGGIRTRYVVMANGLTVNLLVDADGKILPYTVHFVNSQANTVVIRPVSDVLMKTLLQEGGDASPWAVRIPPATTNEEFIASLQADGAAEVPPLNVEYSTTPKYNFTVGTQDDLFAFYKERRPDIDGPLPDQGNLYAAIKTLLDEVESVPGPLGRGDQAKVALILIFLTNLGVRKELGQLTAEDSFRILELLRQNPDVPVPGEVLGILTSNVNRSAAYPVPEPDASAIQSQKEEITSKIAQNEKIVSYLEKDRLTEEEAIDLAKEVVAILKDVYGIEGDIKVIYDPESEYAGEFLPATNTFVIGSTRKKDGAPWDKQIPSALMITQIVVHEMTHVYQFTLIQDLLDGKIKPGDPLYQTAVLMLASTDELSTRPQTPDGVEQKYRGYWHEQHAHSMQAGVFEGLVTFLEGRGYEVDSRFDAGSFTSQVWSVKPKEDEDANKAA